MGRSSRRRMKKRWLWLERLHERNPKQANEELKRLLTLWAKEIWENAQRFDRLALDVVKRGKQFGLESELMNEMTKAVDMHLMKPRPSSRKGLFLTVPERQELAPADKD